MSVAGATAVSGMNAAALRLQVSASNIANAQSGGPLPDAVNAASYPAAYNALRVEQTANADGSTRANRATMSPGVVAAFDPAAPYANAQGLVAAPNVDLWNELIQQLFARISFAANAKMVRADAQMTKSLVDILA